MKKFFTFLFAALMSVSMFGKTVTEDIPLNAETWSWSYGCDRSFNNGMMTCTLTQEWGAAQTGWDPVRDLSEWDKLVVVVESTNGSYIEGGTKLKVYLRDLAHKEDWQGQLEVSLSDDEPDNVPHTLEINLKEEGKNVDLAACGVIGIQSQSNGGIFTISRVYLEKEVPSFEMSYGEDKWLKVTPADEATPYFVFIEDKVYYDNRYVNYDQATMADYMDFKANALYEYGTEASYIFSGVQNLNPNAIYSVDTPAGMDGNSDYVAFVFHYVDHARVGNVEYLVFKYAGEPEQTEGVANTAANVKAVKVIRNGQVLILKNGKTFNALGAEVK